MSAPCIFAAAAIVGQTSSAEKVLETATSLTNSGARPQSRARTAISSRSASSRATASDSTAFSGSDKLRSLSRGISREISWRPAASRAVGRGASGWKRHREPLHRKMIVRYRLVQGGRSDEPSSVEAGPDQFGLVRHRIRGPGRKARGAGQSASTVSISSSALTPAA